MDETVQIKEKNENKVVEGIVLGASYFCPYVKGSMRPDFVDTEKGIVIFWHNPGWVGNWFWKTGIANFKRQFSLTKPEETKNGTVPGITAVSVSCDFKKIKLITNRRFC